MQWVLWLAALLLVPATATVPRIVHMTYSSADALPAKIFDNVRKNLPDFTIRFYNNSDVHEFLSLQFPEAMLAFNGMAKWAHKADLFRYCVLYLTGGLYLDIETRVDAPIPASLFQDDAITTVIGFDGRNLMNGFLAAPPKQIIFRHLIAHILTNWQKVSTLQGATDHYMMIVEFFHQWVAADIGTGLIGGSNIGKLQRYVLLQERKCDPAQWCRDGLDKWGGCFAIFEGSRYVCGTRYPDYDKGHHGFGLD